MRKVIRWILYFIVFFAVWAILLSEKYVTLSAIHKDIIKVLPLYALITFGCYSLGTIGFNLITFPECEKEAKSLEEERKRAVAELRSKGINVKG